MTQPQITSLTQINPITSSTAQVSVTYRLLGILPDFVQIYAVPAGGPVGSAQPVALVDVSPPEIDYTEVITIAAGTYFAIYVCPRTGPQSLPDDLVDDADWTLSCAVKFIVTKTPSSLPTTLAPPVIDNLNPQPATLSQPNRITVVWSSSTNYSKYVLGLTQDGITLASIDVNQPGTSSSWTVPTIPKHHYTFHVNGGISQTWNYNYSKWGPTVKADAIGNLTSLRQYLGASGVATAGLGLRSLVSSGQTLRNFMQL